MVSNVRIAKYCLQLAHIERCYSTGSHNKQIDRCLAYQLYLILIKKDVTPTEGQLVAVTKVYQDLFRPSIKGDGKLCCMHRGTGTGFRFEHSFNISTLRAFDSPEAAKAPLLDLLSRLAWRAIHIHSVVTQHQGQNTDQIPQEVRAFPPQARIPGYKARAQSGQDR